MANQATVRLELDNVEALVLFEFLAREIDDANGKRLKPLTNHDGELWALNALHCVLEKELVAPFQGDYKQQVERANSTLEKLNGGSWAK